MRDAVRIKGRCKGRRAPTQDPSTDVLLPVFVGSAQFGDRELRILMRENKLKINTIEQSARLFFSPIPV